MAKASVELIEILRKTAQSIERSSLYQWGHMGCCNCGFLAQQITHLRKDEIHSAAMLGHGDWTEQLNDYCSTSGLPMDNLISDMVAIGLDPTDLKNLERLSDTKILNCLIAEERNLQHNVKSDVAKYMRTWANLLEEELISQISLSDLPLGQTIL